MGSPFVGMKNMLVVLLAFVIIPTIFATSDDVGSDNSLAPPLSSPPFDSDYSSPPSESGDPVFECPKLSTGEMVDNILEHLKAPKFIKTILKKSAKFADCVSEHYCECLALKSEPAITGCFVEKGIMCMIEAIKGHDYDCVIPCENSIMNAEHRLSDEAIGDLCYRNCMKYS